MGREKTLIHYDYVYDFVNHPYQSEFLDQDSKKLTQSFRIPPGVQSIHGMRVKLSKYGDPGPIYYSLGRQPGEAGIASGIIQPERVLPVFELLVGDDFQSAAVTGGETLYLTLWVENARRPLDAYRIYGPNTRQDLVSEGNARIPYWWHEPAERLDDVNAPLPTLYAGAKHADFAEGGRLLPDGARTWSISFNILTDLDPAPAGKVEQPFEFAQRLLAPPFAEWQNLHDEKQTPNKDELAIDATWGIQNRVPDSPLMRNALAEAHAFFKIVMGVALRHGSSRPGIVFLVCQDGRRMQPEEFLIHISADQVLIHATHERGFLRAVYWLEDQMLIRRAPILPVGEYRIVPRYDVRMAPGLYPAPTYFMLREAQIWTPGYMWRLSRAGYNAVYFQASLEDFVEASAFFPELNDPEASAVIERLRRSVALGAQYGVDFYWDMKTGYERKFPESVYRRLPHLKSFEKFGNFPCTGQELVLNFLRETVSHVFSEVEALKGLIIFYDTEGFYSCITHNSKDQCPYCRDYPIEELSTRLFQALKAAARVKQRDRELVLFTYICDEDWNYRVMEAMPDDITLAACYSQLKELERGGIRILTDDYSLCSAEPSDYFLKVKRLANQKGLRFFAKTEDTFGQEFVSTPFTPCLEQHQRRWDNLNRQQVDGFLSQYLHVGFMPTPCQDLMRQNIDEVFENGALRVVASAERLRSAAVLSFGEAGAPLVVKAWQAFSTAIREYFPYTRGVCRYPGPLQSAPGQPFYLDPAREMPRRWARGYVNDLKWTGIVDRFLVDKDKTWDERVVAACFQDMLRYYQQGNQYLEEAIRASQPADRPLLAAVLRVSRMQYCQMKTLVNLIEFLRLREDYRQTPARAVRDSLVRVLESELENAGAALALSSRDSRLGFSGEGDGNVRGGHFNPFTIGQKMSELRQALDACRQPIC
jgi:hypothetical protein